MKTENINLVVGRRQKNISADIETVNKQAIIQDHISISFYFRQLRTKHINTNLHKYKNSFDSSKDRLIDTKILSHVNLQLSQNLQLPVGIGELLCSEHLKDGDLLVPVPKLTL